jgi:hypothetical protein
MDTCVFNIGMTVFENAYTIIHVNVHKYYLEFL